MESVQEQKEMAPIETKELQNLEEQMEQIHHAFSLVKEIRQTLENSLKNL